MFRTTVLPVFSVCGPLRLSCGVFLMLRNTVFPVCCYVNFCVAFGGNVTRHYSFCTFFFRSVFDVLNHLSFGVFVLRDGVVFFIGAFQCSKPPFLLYFWPTGRYIFLSVCFRCSEPPLFLCYMGQRAVIFFCGCVFGAQSH
ncbi:unnamed protein product, partial [Ectocarpus sp. 13 AM-2016]